MSIPKLDWGPYIPHAACVGMVLTVAAIIAAMVDQAHITKDEAMEMVEACHLVGGTGEIHYGWIDREIGDITSVRCERPGQLGPVDFYPPKPVATMEVDP